MHNRTPFFLLALGDAVTLLLVSLAGFASHSQALTANRFFAVYLPLLAAWGLYSPWFQVYHPAVTFSPKKVWQPVLAVLLAVPLAVILRGFWLGQAVVPLFTLVLGLFSALGIGIWRLIWVFIRQAKAPAWTK